MVRIRHSGIGVWCCLVSWTRIAFFTGSCCGIGYYWFAVGWFVSSCWALYDLVVWLHKCRVVVFSAENLHQEPHSRGRPRCSLASVIPLLSLISAMKRIAWFWTCSSSAISHMPLGSYAAAAYFRWGMYTRSGRLIISPFAGQSTEDVSPYLAVFSIRYLSIYVFGSSCSATTRQLASMLSHLVCMMVCPSWLCGWRWVFYSCLHWIPKPIW